VNAKDSIAGWDALHVRKEFVDNYCTPFVNFFVIVFSVYCILLLARGVESCILFCVEVILSLGCSVISVAFCYLCGYSLIMPYWL
jgi:hypothetical protein